MQLVNKKKTTDIISRINPAKLSFQPVHSSTCSGVSFSPFLNSFNNGEGGPQYNVLKPIKQSEKKQDVIVYPTN